MKHVPRALAIMGAVLFLTAAVASAAGSGSVAARKLDAAEAAFAAKDWDNASVLFRELAEENPFQGRFWYQWGTTEYNRKRYREAIAPYQRSAAVGYNVGTSHYNRGCCLALLGETDAAIVANAFVPTLLEQGFNKLYDFVEDTKPHGRPDRVTIARKSFIERNPELVLRYWKAQIRGYQSMSMAPENFPFHRYVEAKLRVDNPDESERMRDLLSQTLMESYFVPLDGHISEEGVWRILEEHQDAGVLSRSITRQDVKEVIRQELAQEAWQEISQTEEVKRNLERLQPIVEKYGY